MLSHEWGPAPAHPQIAQTISLVEAFTRVNGDIALPPEIQTRARGVRGNLMRLAHHTPAPSGTVPYPDHFSTEPSRASSASTSCLPYAASSDADDVHNDMAIFFGRSDPDLIQMQTLVTLGCPAMTNTRTRTLIIWNSPAPEGTCSIYCPCCPECSTGTAFRHGPFPHIFMRVVPKACPASIVVGNHARGAEARIKFGSCNSWQKESMPERSTSHDCMTTFYLLCVVGHFIA